MASASKPISATTQDSPNARAAAAADSVLTRHLRPAWRIPGTRVASVAWSPHQGAQEFLRSQFGSWHYWWHAHLLDLIVDAGIHRPGSGSGSGSADSPMAITAERLLRGIMVRNLGRWTNNYYDDMAWLGLAIERADRHLGLPHAHARRVLAARMYAPWSPERGGGIPWRTLDTFFNAPANGPATILLARIGSTDRALQMCDWMDSTLIDPTSHLVIDGIRPRDNGFEPVEAIYTYCQGVVLGAEVEAARLTGDAVHVDRIERLLAAIETHECPEGVIRGAGGGDGGLFIGVLARYLALAATDLPLALDGAQEIRRRAGALVLRTAEAVWDTRIEVDDALIFSADWHRTAQAPTRQGKAASFAGGAVHSSEIPERDLSVQLSGWMALEAAAAVDLGLSEHHGPA